MSLDAWLAYNAGVSKRDTREARTQEELAEIIRLAVRNIHHERQSNETVDTVQQSVRIVHPGCAG